MYHYTNEYIQPMYHNEYQPCSYLDTRNTLNPVIHNETSQIEAVNSHKLPPAVTEDVAKFPALPPEVPKPKTLKAKKVSSSSRTVIDTSQFTIEERLVAAVWVHERKRTRSSMTQINRDFKRRFGREAPAKNTLLVWERKLFSTGSVHDAPRTGRPSNRRSHVDQVAASVTLQPLLSLRARATILRVPRTTLRTILHKDLPHIVTKTTEGKAQSSSNGKVKQKKAQRQSKVRLTAPPAPLAPPPPPPRYL